MNFNLKNKYHATNSYFKEFDITSDIGFHFGSKKAATDRLKSIGGKPNVTIELNSYPQKNPFDIKPGDESSNDITSKAIAIIVPRLNSPTMHAVNKILKCTDDELLEFIDEFKDKPVTQAYEKIIANVGKNNDYSVLIDGSIQGDGFLNKADAVKLKRDIESSFMKKVDLSLINPLRMDDLGQWSPHSIAYALDLDSELYHEILSLDKESAYKKLREVIRASGHDGIIYKNAVEGTGDSYIVFDKSQIDIHPSKTPEAPTPN